MAGFPELRLQPDVEAGMRALHGGGVRMVTLTNGSSETTEKLLARGGVVELVERHLSVATVGRWKPAPEPYRHAARVCEVPVDRLALVAVHP